MKDRFRFDELVKDQFVILSERSESKDLVGTPRFFVRDPSLTLRMTVVRQPDKPEFANGMLRNIGLHKNMQIGILPNFSG